MVIITSATPKYYIRSVIMILDYNTKSEDVKTMFKTHFDCVKIA